MSVGLEFGQFYRMRSPAAPPRSDAITRQLRVHLLGTFQAFLDDQHITSFESNKVRALLAYLAVEGRQAQPRERLAVLLWPDWPQKSAMDNLRYALSDLRKNLRDREADPPFLIITRETICLNQAADWQVDTVEFETLIRQPEVDHLQAAVDLYRGAFMDGFFLADSPGFEQWVLAKREHYNRLELRTLQQLAERCEQAGEYERGLAYLRQQLTLESWLEEAHRQVMRLLALNGQRSQALAQYEVCKQALKTELNAEPSLETIQLYEAIRKDEYGKEKQREGEAAKLVAPPIAFPERPRHNLPRQRTRLIGREEELSEIQALIDAHPLVTLTGSGGVGKTRLGIQAAQQLVERFEDGAWFIELAPLSDPSQLFQRINKTLGLIDEARISAQETLLSFLASRQMLLVLDNCEHLIAACAQLADDILRECPRSKLLATSREALGVSGERMFHVPSLEIPDPKQALVLDQLMQVEAVRLFYERAREVLPSYEITDKNAEQIIQICRRLDGIPLAIELAAARLNLLTTQQLASRLDDAFRLLTGGSRAALPRQQTLRATIDWSYQLLSQPERLLLQRVSVFSGGWFLEAVEEICSSSEIPKESILDVLSGLVDKSVVLAERMPGEEALYRLLETVRQYAREKLIDAGEIQELRDRHLAYYVKLAEEAEPLMYGPQRLDCQKRLNTELDNFRAAIEWSFGGRKEAEPGLHIAAAIGRRFMQTRAYYDETISWLLSGLELVPVSPIPLLLHARVLNTLGWLAGNLGIHSGQQQWYSDCVDLCRHIGAPAQAELAWALCGLADFFPTDQASVLYQEALQLARQLEPTTLNLWYLSLFLANNPYPLPHSRTNLLESYQLLQQIGAHWDIAGTYWWMASYATAQKDFQQAVNYCERALDLFMESGDLTGIAGTYGWLSTIYRDQNNWSKAYACCKEFILHSYNMGGKDRCVQSLINAAGIYLDICRGGDVPDYLPLLETATILMGFTDRFKFIIPWILNIRVGLSEALPQLLDPKLFAQAYERGQKMTADEAVKLALSISF